jgi:hypothetical protein
VVDRDGHGAFGFPPSVTRFDLSGYVLETRYTLGRNTGNTFQQTYTASSVQGVPTEGPFVGQDFDPADYVALPVGHKTLYIAWLNPNHDIIDALVMNPQGGRRLRPRAGQRDAGELGHRPHRHEGCEPHPVAPEAVERRSCPVHGG